MSQEKEAFEKIPDFTFSNNDETNFQEKDEKPVISHIDNILPGFDAKNRSNIKANILKPAKLRVEQAFSLVDFESYKGNLSTLFDELSALFQAVSKWNEESPLIVSEQITNSEISMLMSKIGYLPNNPFLPNLLQVLVSVIENSSFDIGSAMHTEIIFQSFKRIYNQRVQMVLHPFAQYIYNLDRKLMPIKKIAWQLLNKNGRTFEAAFIMDDIQKSIIRIKKSQELLIQEKYNLEEKCEENIDLLLLMADKQEVLYPIYKAYKENQLNNSLDLEKYLSELYELANQPLKPLSQQLLNYKTGSYGEKIINKIDRWTGKNTGIEFKRFLLDCFEYPLSGIDINSKNFPLIVRDIIFATMETAKKHGWGTTEIIQDLVFVIFNTLNIDDKNNSPKGAPVFINSGVNKNNLRLVAYTIGSECIAGIIKVKYKIDEAVLGLAKGLVHLIPLSITFNRNDFFCQDNNYRIITEFIYSGMWDSTLEVYPNLSTVEKNGELFTSTIKSESKKLNFSIETNKLKTFQANLVINPQNQF